MSAAKGARCAVVLGVQGPDLDAARRYARQAGKLGPDAIIALPPRESGNLDHVAEYYRGIAKECALPLFVQTIGNMSVEFVVRLRKDIPSLRFVKDEAGHTLLIVVSLVSVRQQLVDVYGERVVLVGAELAGIGIQGQHAGVERAVGRRCANIRLIRDAAREQVDGAAVIRGSDR